MNENTVKKTLSIVVPTYNLKEKIIDLIESFNFDTHDFSDVEVLIINDGSTDSTQKFAEKCQMKYPRTIRVINKKNGGHGSAINTGIELASGKYFKVIDGDDIVNDNNFEQLLLFLRQTNSDLILTPYCKLFMDDSSTEICEVINQELKYEVQYSFVDVLDKINTFGLHSSTFKTSILKENNIHVDEKVFYDDTQYSVYPVPFISTVSFTRKYVYVYRLGFEEQSMNIDNRWKRRNQLEHVVMNIVRFFEDTPDSVIKEKYINRFTSECVLCVYDLYLCKGETQNDKKQLANFDRNLKNISKGIYETTFNKKTYMLRKSKFLLYGALRKAYVKNKK